MALQACQLGQSFLIRYATFSPAILRKDARCHTFKVAFIYLFVFLYSFYYIKICATFESLEVQTNQPWKKLRLTFVCYSTEPCKTPLGRLTLHHFIDFELPKGGGFHIAKTIIIIFFYYDCWRYRIAPITCYVLNPLSSCLDKAQCAALGFIILLSSFANASLLQVLSFLSFRAGIGLA